MMNKQRTGQLVLFGLIDQNFAIFSSSSVDSAELCDVEPFVISALLNQDSKLPDCDDNC
jgi:hypothetical protein